MLLIMTPFLFVRCDNKEAANGPGAAAGGAPQGMPGGPGNVPVPRYDAVIARGFEINREIQSPGTILAEETTNLQPEISGRITGIYFNEGSFVPKNKLLVKLNDADLLAQRSKMEVQLKIAEASELRQKELLAVNGTSQQEYDLATLAVSNIKADMELNAVNLAKTEIRAPFAGKLGLRNVSLGAYVSPQTILSNISQVSTLKIEFNVIEKYTTDLHIGKVVRFKTETSQNTYDAKIIAFENTLTSDTRQLKIRAQVLRPDRSLTPGSFISVNFSVGSSEPAIMVPAQSIIPQARDRQVIIYQNGQANFIKVITGFRDSSRVEVLEGIKAGDTILTTGLLTIRPGAKIDVRITE
jgi:membrane fusion protein (multidrug efflux system)